MRIVIADDHQIVRKGLQFLLARRPGWEIAAEASRPEELFAELAGDRFDVLVLDIRLGGVSGFEVLRRVRRDHPKLPVLVLSMLPESQHALPALREGAGGYVQKDATADEILSAIERVAAGRRWFSSDVAELLAEQLAHPAARLPHERLSTRELEVFRRLAAGESVTEIASTMSLSVKTVSTYRARVLQKTGFRSNAEIVTYAVRNGLV
ncbi:MAG TPA: response regulator transcription factor [Thermoanaerobaculia bacterium]|nr:response regulator transcription factor [Thermoanaerobaculia bacterium]